MVELISVFIQIYIYRKSFSRDISQIVAVVLRRRTSNTKPTRDLRAFLDQPSGLLKNQVDFGRDVNITISNWTFAKVTRN
jgi:hypothetical protein